ncbi:MAG: hypothetical protein ACRYGI_07155, partial [Janthinobacterium lividum]
TGQPGSLADMANKAPAMANQAADKASSLLGQVKDKATTAVESRKHDLADRVDEIAGAVHKSSEQFEGQDWIASAIERGAAELSTVATALRENDLNGMIGQVRNFARQQPAAFIGASLVAGFALARFGKIIAADVSRDDLPTLPEVTHGQG